MCDACIAEKTTTKTIYIYIYIYISKMPCGLVPPPPDTFKKNAPKRTGNLLEESSWTRLRRTLNLFKMIDIFMYI